MELNFAQKSNEIPNGNIVAILIDNLLVNELPIELNSYWFIDSQNNWEKALKDVLDLLLANELLLVILFSLV